MNKKMYYGAGAITAIALTAGAAGLVTASQPAEHHLSYEGTIKPGAEITVSASCEDGSTPAVFSSLFGEVTLDESGHGNVTLPTNIGPGPDNGYHTLSLNCDNDDVLSVRPSDDGNGTAKTIADKNN